MTTTIEIERLLNWSDGKRVSTRNGPRILHTAAPTESFWQTYRAHKTELGAEGVSVGRDKNNGAWQVCWWKPLPAEELARMQANIEASQRTSVDIHIPKPDNGKDYFPFQKAGIVFARSKDGILFGDEMGLGKTIQAIGVLNDRPDISKVLVVCPASLKRNWQRELLSWLKNRDLDIAIAQGNHYPQMADVVIMNYDILGRHAETLAETKWQAIIADEAHFIKNLKTKRTKALLALNAGLRMALTGTPILNNIGEIFPMLHWLNPEEFRNIYSFLRKFSDGRGNSSPEDRARLQKRLRESVMVRRLKSEVLTELPAKSRQVIELDPPQEVLAAERDALAAREDDMAMELESALELAKVARDDKAYQEALSQLQDGARIAFENIARVRHQTALSKLPYTLQHAQECLDNGVKKLLIFGHHRDCLEHLHANLPGSVLHYGGISEQAKDAAVQKFMNDPECTAFVGSIRAAGMGLTLTAASHVLFHELDWVPAMMTQAEDRCHRIGQHDNVLVQLVVFSGTIDCNMAHACVDKQNLADQALDADRDKLLNEPVLPTRSPRKGRITISTKELEERTIDPSAKAAVHLGLRMLAGLCDGARQLDDQGFNKFDTHLGKKLALMPTLTDGQAILGQKLVRKYKRQLPEDLVEKATR